jgi:hypothetical protein
MEFSESQGSHVTGTHRQVLQVLPAQQHVLGDRLDGLFRAVCLLLAVFVLSLAVVFFFRIGFPGHPAVRERGPLAVGERRQRWPRDAAGRPGQRPVLLRSRQRGQAGRQRRAGDQVPQHRRHGQARLRSLHKSEARASGQGSLEVMLGRGTLYSC